MKKKTTSKNNYWTQINEEAVDNYNNTTNNKIKNDIYQYIIKPVFMEMIKKIMYRYKFANLPNTEDLLMECEGHLVSVLSKFKRDKGFKAFAYFSVITKNWFTQKAKKYSAQLKRESVYDDIVINENNEELILANSLNEEEFHNNFMKLLRIKFDDWEKMGLKPNEIKVLQAIRIILEASDSLEIFNKKAFYIYCREITGLNTKQILNNLGRIRFLYKEFKHNCSD